MAHRIEFTPNFSVAGTFHATYQPADFAGERSMYACSPDYGGMSQNVNTRAPPPDPGDSPAAPGWHCDSRLRELHFGQGPGARVPVEQSLLCTASTHADGVSNTQFLTR